MPEPEFYAAANILTFEGTIDLGFIVTKNWAIQFLIWASLFFFLGPFPLAEIPKDKDTHRQSTLQHFFVVLSITCSMECMSE